MSAANYKNETEDNKESDGSRGGPTFDVKFVKAFDSTRAALTLDAHRLIEAK